MEIDNKVLIQNYIKNIVNTGNTSHISDFIGSEYTEVFGGNRKKIGIEGAIEHIKGVHRTYPDLKLIIDQQISERDWVVTCYTMTGTHKGEWMGIKPTFKKLTVTGVNVDRIFNGKIVEHGGAANLLEPLLKVKAIGIIEKTGT